MRLSRSQRWPRATKAASWTRGLRWRQAAKHQDNRTFEKGPFRAEWSFSFAGCKPAQEISGKLFSLNDSSAAPKSRWIEPTHRAARESAHSMKTLSQISTMFLGAAIAFTPALAMSQQGARPETAIPRHTKKGGNGNFVPPPDRKAPPDTHHDIPAHPNQSKDAKSNKKARGDDTGNGSNPSRGSDSASPQ